MSQMAAALKRETHHLLIDEELAHALILLIRQLIDLFLS